MKKYLVSKTSSQQSSEDTVTDIFFIKIFNSRAKENYFNGRFDFRMWTLMEMKMNFSISSCFWRLSSV